jgi:hypothetical protein
MDWKRERENERELGGKRGSDSCGDCFGTLGIPLVLSMWKFEWWIDDDDGEIEIGVGEKEEGWCFWFCFYRRWEVEWINECLAPL